jgi:hypothetical protein
MTTEEDAQTAALQEYFDSNTPAGYGASFRAGWEAGRGFERREQIEPTRAVYEQGVRVVQAEKDAEIERLNRLVDTISRALARYQDEEQEVGGDDPVDHPYQRRGSWSHDDWCAAQGCTSKASVHQESARP